MRCGCGGTFVPPVGTPGATCPYCYRQVDLAPPQGTPTEARRTWSLVLIAAALVMTLVGAFSKHWLVFSEGDEEARVGLLGYEECRRGECHGQAFSADGRDATSTILGVVGKVALAGTIGLGGVLVWCGVGVAQRRPSMVAMILGIVLASLGLVGASMWAYEIKTHLREEEISYGYGLLLYASGTIAAIVGCVLSSARARSPR